MRGPEQLHGVRIVATPAAIDAATAVASGREAIVIRIAADDAFMIGVTDVQLDDPHAIVEPESAFVGWWITPDEVTAHVARYVEWQLPQPQAGHTQLAQGLVRLTAFQKTTTLLKRSCSLIRLLNDWRDTCLCRQWKRAKT